MTDMIEGAIFFITTIIITIIIILIVVTSNMQKSQLFKVTVACTTAVNFSFALCSFLTDDYLSSTKIRQNEQI